MCFYLEKNWLSRNATQSRVWDLNFVNKLFIVKINVFEVNFYKVVWIIFVNTWKFILKQLVASGSVITSLYSLRLRLSEYMLVITSPSATNC
jgi:hypothetical protein